MFNLKNGDILTVQGVAHEKHCSEATVRIWERSGKLPAIRTASGMRLFLRSDVDRVEYKPRRSNGR